MGTFVLGGIVIGCLLLLILLGMPIGFTLFFSGFIGYWAATDFITALNYVTIKGYGILDSFSFMCIPLFVLMGLVAAEAGFVSMAFETAKRWLSRVPGGIAQATTLASAFYGSVSGSSAAMAASMGVIAYPEMRKLNYNPGFSASCIGIGGTIGILIPPSVPMIFYGIIMDTSISQLFMAGLIPGIILTIFLLITIWIIVLIRPDLVPKETQMTYTFAEMISSLKYMIPIVILFGIVVGGIYAGIFTPSEAGALGAFAAFVMGFISKTLNRQKILTILKEAGLISGMLFLVIWAAHILSDFCIVSGLGNQFGDLIMSLGLPNWGILVAIVIVFLILGMLMEVNALFMITLPIFGPIITNMGFDLIWFGVFATILAEACLISPPVGLNVYVLKGVTTDTTIENIFKWIMLFLPALLILLALIVIFPSIATWLPNTM
jgi:tripartite ATP-independent transporter DctM subunit